jgi:hypothetical protein
VLLSELRRAGRDPGPRAGRRTRGAVRQALARRLLSRALPGVLHPECRAPGRLLRELVEEGDSETAVRAVRRALLGFRALDPRCGSGAWLLEVAAVLEPLWLGVLGRMRARLEDARRAGERRRPEWLRDFRLALARADEPRWLTPRHHVRQTIVTLGLHGADGDAAALARCRAALERWAGGPGLPALALNLRPDTGEAAHPARGRGGGEALEAAVRAARRLRSAWLEGADAVSTAEGAERVRARLETLAAERGLSPAERFGLPARPGFDLVREAGG